MTKNNNLIYSYVVEKYRYNIFRVLLCIHFEKIHRLVFDKLYKQDYDIKIKDKPLLIYYDILFKTVPYFRPYLKKWSEVLRRAYNQRRVSAINFIFYWKLKKVNTEHYSAYFI